MARRNKCAEKTITNVFHHTRGLLTVQVLPVGASVRVASPGPDISEVRRAASASDFVVGRAQSVAGVRNPGLVALRLQRELSVARVAAGEAERAYRAAPFWSASRKELRATRDARQADVRSLETREAEQAAVMLPDVQKARFQVLLERLPVLEAKVGTNEAARLARQTYYAGPAWDGVAAAGRVRMATRWEIQEAGLPHGIFNEWNAAGGFDGDMRMPDGTPVDVGHMFCGVDWQVNGRVAKGAWSIEAVTIGGDLSTAMASITSATAEAGRAALSGELGFDMNGDLDGLNIAQRLAKSPGTSMSSAVAAYYGRGLRRVNEYVTHAKWIVRNADGTPKRTRYGGYELDHATFRRNTGWMANLIRVWNGRMSTVSRAEQDAVIDAFAEWLRENSQ